jgi:hypothetical protein
MQGAALDQFMSLDYLQFDAVALLFKKVGRVYKVPTNIVLLICDTHGAITGASSEGNLEVTSNVAFLLLTSSGDAGHYEYMAPVLDPSASCEWNAHIRMTRMLYMNEDEEDRYNIPISPHTVRSHTNWQGHHWGDS